MTREVDPYRYESRLNKRIVESWIAREPQREIPWAPLNKPLADCRVALLSSAALAHKDDKPFDQEGERRNPWWGDPSYRILPATIAPEDVRIYHLHVRPDHARADLNVILPLDRLRELAAAGVIGDVAPTHYSIMGYILDETELLRDTVPAIVARLRAEEVDVLLLAPV